MNWKNENRLVIADQESASSDTLNISAHLRQVRTPGISARLWLLPLVVLPLIIGGASRPRAEEQGKVPCANRRAISIEGVVISLIGEFADSDRKGKLLTPDRRAWFWLIRNYKASATESPFILIRRDSSLPTDRVTARNDQKVSLPSIEQMLVPMMWDVEIRPPKPIVLVAAATQETSILLGGDLCDDSSLELPLSFTTPESKSVYTVFLPNDSRFENAARISVPVLTSVVGIMLKKE